ncbi:MAG: phage tail protein [Mesorhizobium sp.]|nr:MAG: phage tail protein [Mesorhizobium sp.]
MALETFVPPVPPMPGTRNKPELKLLKAEFGDGYTQTARDGINHMRRTLSLRWEKLLPWQKDEIIGFLEARGGSEAFYYTPSNETNPVKWTCEDWDDTRSNDGMDVTAVLRQSFNLES